MRPRRLTKRSGTRAGEGMGTSGVGSAPRKRGAAFPEAILRLKTAADSPGTAIQTRFVRYGGDRQRGSRTGRIDFNHARREAAAAGSAPTLQGRNARREF